MLRRQIRLNAVATPNTDSAVLSAAGSVPGAAVPVVAPAHLPRFPLFAPLAVPAYALFWVAGVLIYISENFRSIAGASITLDLTCRPSGLANLQALGTTLNVLIMLFGGVAADRFRPHRVLVAAMLIHAAAAAVMGILAFFGSLVYWQLIVVTLVSGMAGGLFNGSFFAVIPDLLPGDRLRTANALISVTENLSRFVIPPLAGLTVAAAGAPPALALSAASAFLAGAALAQIRLAPREPAAGDAGAAEQKDTAGILARLREGLRASRSDGAVWTLIWAGAVLIPGAFCALATGVPPLAKLTLEAGDGGIGILYGGLGAGALAGALAAGVARSVRRPGLFIILGILGEGVAIAATGLAPTLWIAAATLACAGFLQAVRIILASTIIQGRTAPAVRGRVISVAVLFAVAPQIAGFALAGQIGDALGPRSIMLIGGALVVLGAALIASQKSVRSLTA